MKELSTFVRNIGVGERAFVVKAKVNEMMRKGINVIELEIGEPDFNTPENIRNAIKQAINEGKTHYETVQGSLELRKVIAHYVSKTRQVIVDADSILVTGGAKPMIFYALNALLNEGDEVIIPDPTYPVYDAVSKGIGAKIVYLPVLEENDFSFDRNYFRKIISKKTKVFVYCSPSNPTGGAFSREDIEFIAEMAEKYDFYIICDEIYSRLLYERKHESILSIEEMPERTIMVDGFSKTYAMTGLRLGYGVIKNSDVMNVVKKIAGNDQSCVTSSLQYGGIEALNGPQNSVDQMVREFKERRDILVEGLNSIEGVTCRKPIGAFYAFPNVKALCKKKGLDSAGIEEAILENPHVAVLSGTSFGEHGEGYLRLSYANSKENLREAIKRIKNWVEKDIVH